jgi:hypothetical protein
MVHMVRCWAYYLLHKIVTRDNQKYLMHEKKAKKA